MPGFRFRCVSALVVCLSTGVCASVAAAEDGDVHDLAAGRVPTGSSSSRLGNFAGAVDGRVEAASWWRSAQDDYPGFLVLDFGAPAIVSSMNITSGSSGFKAMRTYCSDNGRSWVEVRYEATPLNCEAGATTEHDGLAEATRYIMIQMEDRCSGVHPGNFTVAEWGVFGRYSDEMVRRYSRMWPHCDDLRCFSHVELQEARAVCLATPECDGFSFSSATMDGGFGSGCYKASCPNSSSRDFGRGSHGFWEKRRGGGRPGFPSHVDSSLALEAQGPWGGGRFPGGVRRVFGRVLRDAGFAPHCVV